MRAILINPTLKTVEEVEVKPSPDTLHHWYELLGVDLVTVGLYLDDHDSIIVDDEGLLKSPEQFFFYKGGHQPFAGNGLVVGVDEEGESVSANITLQEVRNNVMFMDKPELVKRFINGQF